MKCRAAVLSVFILIAMLVPARATPKTLSLKIEEGKLTGPGAELLRAEVPKAQFILWGEDHGFADSAVVLRALARGARPAGFRYHVVEVGPLSTRIIRDTLARDGVPALHRLVHEVPMGIPFLSLEEDAELASDFVGKDSKDAPYLWGVDQEFIGSPLVHLERLKAIAPNESARDAAEKLLVEEKEAAANGADDKFVLARLQGAEFDALVTRFKGQAEAELVIEELKESAAIYQLWRSRRNYENNARRARLLAKNFLAAYKSAAESQPKVIFKMGLEHVALGTTTVNTIDLGTLATSIATTNGKTALRIAFIPMGGRNTTFAPKPGNPTSVESYDSTEAKEFFGAIGLDAATVEREGWTLVPLEPIRQSLDNKGIDALKPFSRFTLLGYDYIVTTRDAKPGTFLY